MTVRRSGDGPGDGGELPASAGVSSPPLSTSRPPLGRFWALSSDDLDSSSDEGDDEGCPAKALAYLCRSPSPDEGRDLSETSSGFARRAERRLERQRQQRLAARQLCSPVKVRSPTLLPSFSADFLPSSRLPVLQPSTFTIDADDAVGWTLVQRRRRASSSSFVAGLDPVFPLVSKQKLLGSVLKSKHTNACVSGRPPFLNAARREARRSKAQAVPTKNPIDGHIAVGRSCRRNLGHSRANANTRGGGVSVVGGSSAGDMSNGNGGFGPGRGAGPGRGRGDRGDRGGFGGPGRGANYGNNGNGFGGPSGFSNHGNGRGAFSGRPGNFVTGESSGTAGEDVAQGQRFNGEFAAEVGQFNRGSNFNNYNRPGGNQHYRPRSYGNNNYYANNRYGFNGGRSNFSQNRSYGGGSSDTGNQNNGSLAGVNPDLFKEAIQGVVAAITAAAQKGGLEVPTSASGVAVPATTQAAAPVQQPQVTGLQQVQPMQVETEIVPRQEGTNPAKKAKKTEKNPCFRCKQPGHQIDTCTAPVCDICESTNHISSACPLLLAPKPSVTLYGYAIEQLMFFEVPTGGSYKPKVDNLKLVKVTVEGDPMSIPDIADCLKRIVPVENFQWEIYNFQNNVFRVKFPNKSEAQRMKNFRTYPVPDRGSDLVFEDWSALEDPLYMLPEVWLRVRGIPADVRTDFLSLWAVGTLFGKTKEVDMVHTRKNKELRLRIGCLDHTLIPETTYVFIQRGFFKLSFEVEPVTVIQLETDGLDNDGGNNGRGDNNGSDKDNTDDASDMDFEKTINSIQQQNNNGQQGTMKNVSNAKSVSAHQAQHQIEAPILFGSLKKDLLSSAQKDIEGAVFKVVSASGSPKGQAAVALGLETPGLADADLPLGRQPTFGVQLVDADVAAPPRAITPLAPLSPGRRSPRSPGRPTSEAGGEGADTSGTRALVAESQLGPEALAAALLATQTTQTAPPVGMARRGASPLAAVSVGCNPKGGSVQPVMAREHGLLLQHGHQMHMGSSVASPTVGCSIVSTKNTERAKKASLENDVVAFGGIAAPSMSVRASDRIRAQPNADATQMERAMQNANFRHDFTAPGYPHYGSLDPALAFLAPGGSAGVHGFWMQPPSNGCPGYFLPGYLAAY
ncbi:uncharacterized protein [Lolium perenne]|uniref:uncharacterized protein isoform X2 n=1 Tax=Lolium perenne TaxID=4522 RepID=UPI0021F534A6|nr:uncharacterized protein LOC127311710 isoform X2 [Lolium perenne]